MTTLTWRDGNCGCDGESICVNHRYIHGQWSIRVQSATFDQSEDYWVEVFATHRAEAEEKALLDQPEDAYVCEAIPPSKPEYDSCYGY